jgi:TDG/mug DNA glycosylase family protein
VEELDLARLTPEATPAALAEWQRAHASGAELDVHWRWFGPVPFAAVAHGAGTAVVTETEGLGLAKWRLRREATLADLVAPLLAVLVVGLNPSVVAAEQGVPFAGASNRFWPAALDAGLVRADRDPWGAFVDAHVGFSDLVKRASPRADGLTREEYADGAARLRAVVEWLQPAVVCFAGLTGYRKAVDPDATEGNQPTRFGGAATYVMPNPSGANAHASRDDLVAHLTAVRALAASAS